MRTAFTLATVSAGLTSGDLIAPERIRVAQPSSTAAELALPSAGVCSHVQGLIDI